MSFRSPTSVSFFSNFSTFKNFLMNKNVLIIQEIPPLKTYKHNLFFFQVHWLLKNKLQLGYPHFSDASLSRHWSIDKLIREQSCSSVHNSDACLRTLKQFSVDVGNICFGDQTANRIELPDMRRKTLKIKTIKFFTSGKVIKVTFLRSLINKIKK